MSKNKNNSLGVIGLLLLTGSIQSAVAPLRVLVGAGRIITARTAGARWFSEKQDQKDEVVQQEELEKK